MGANHFSLAIYGANVGEVRDAITRWLRAKGYDLRADAQITSLDTDKERGIELRWTDRCVVVLNDNLGERDRLLFELKRLDKPVLDYWMHDSDVWGYTLWHRTDAVAGFVSDPNFGGVYEAATGPDDVEALCRLTGSAGSEKAVRGIQREKALFAEDSGRRFVTAIGAEGAAAIYGDLTGVPVGVQSESMWFRRAGWHPMAGFDLGSVRFRVHEALAGQAATPEEMAAAEARVASARRWASVVRFVLWPLLLPLRLWWWWRLRRASATLTKVVPPVVQEPAFEVVGDRLVNKRLRCSLTLAPGAVVLDYHRLGAWPGAAFAFQAGGHHVSARALWPAALRFAEVLGPPDTKIDQEDLVIGGRPAKRVSVAAPGGTRRFVLVHGPECLLWFEVMAPQGLSDEAREAFDRTVESLVFEA